VDGFADRQGLGHEQAMLGVLLLRLVLTLGVGGLFLRAGGGVEPRWQRTIGALLLVSALCYLPVVLWIQKIPLLGLSKPRTKCQTGGTLKVLSSTAIPGYCLMAGMGEMGSETSQPDSERLSP
jgi:hypothetical protein